MDLRSTKKKAPFPPQGFNMLKDTFGHFNRPYDESSSVNSSVTEMSKFEEQQLSRSFQAIQRPETPKKEEEQTYFNPMFQDTEQLIHSSDKEEETEEEHNYFNPMFQDTEQPGNPLDQEEETVLRPSIRRQDSEDSDVDTYDKGSPIEMSQRTEESVLSSDREEDREANEDEKFTRARPSGMFNTSIDESKEYMGSIDSSFARVSSRDNMEISDDMLDTIEKLTGPTQTSDWDTVIPSPDNSIHILPSYTRERTPDATASRGNLSIGAFGSKNPVVNRGNLGATTRDHIRNAYESGANSNGGYNSNGGNNSPGVQVSSGPGSNLRQTMRDVIRENDSHHFSIGQNTVPKTVVPPNVRKTDVPPELDDEKEPKCWPRCVLVVACLLILLAGIIALLVVFKDQRKQEGKFGSVNPNPITHQECSDVTVNMTDSFTIKCEFDVTHEFRKWIKNGNGNVNVTVNLPDQTQITLAEEKFDTTGNWTWTRVDNATCASIGRYSVTFTDRSGSGETLTISFLVTAPAPTVQTSMVQEFNNDTAGSSYFNIECSYSGDCINYQVDVIGQNGVPRDTLSENQRCSNSFSNSNGVNKTCMTTIPEATIAGYSRLQCRLSNMDMEPIYTTLTFPVCGIICQQNTVNCTSKSTTKENIDNCQFDTNFMDTCFHPGRKVYSHCAPEGNVCTCKLNWCERRNRIFTDEEPGNLLCGNDYNPITYTAKPTITTNTGTSSSTTSPTSTSTSILTNTPTSTSTSTRTSTPPPTSQTPTPAATTQP